MIDDDDEMPLIEIISARITKLKMCIYMMWLSQLKIIIIIVPNTNKKVLDVRQSKHTEWKKCTKK